jgi:hypothetical protein
MVEKLILAFLLVIYAVGCAATAVELHAQRDTTPSGRELAIRYPRVNVLALGLMIAGWPLMLTWIKVREGWR